MGDPRTSGHPCDPAAHTGTGAAAGASGAAAGASGGAATSGDDLVAWRSEFPILERTTYLVSHSMGAAPRGVAEALREYAGAWSEHAAAAWERWLPMVVEAGDRVARLIGAVPGSVMMGPNVSHFSAVIASCLEFRPPRDGVVYTALQFPSVSYLWKAQERRGARVTIVPSRDGIGVATEDLLAAIDERTLIVPISHVLFRSSFVQDVAAVVRRAREVGALVALDAYQSVGVLPLDVTALGVDMLLGGSHKWLCGGPGAAFLYVRPELRARLRPAVTGWFAHARPFAFEMPEQDWADDVWRLGGGTPAIPALYAARPGHEILLRVGVDRVRERSLRLTSRIVARALDAGIEVRSPLDPERRGGSVVLEFSGSGPAHEDLCRRGLLCDWRPGAGIRVGPHFYNTEEEVDRFMDELVRLARAPR